MKNRLIIKWIFQFFLASVFSLLALRYSPYFASGPSMGQMLFAALIATPIGVVIGVVIGDISLYTTHKFSILALIITIILAFSTMYFWFFLRGLVEKSMPKIPWPMNWILLLVIIVIPSLVGYNFLSSLSRKSRSKRAEKVQTEVQESG